MTEKPRRLGRGLEALLSGSQKGAEPVSGAERGERRIPIASIRPNPYQPRKDFRPEDLAELESSLRASGLLQPITVRPTAERGAYELVAGERRLRAATRIGWSDIPVIVRELDDRAMLTLALVENLQRADLNAIEEAEGYRRLLDEFGLTQQQVAEAVGKERTTVTNTLRLLSLPEPVKRMVRQGSLTVGHARALLALPSEKAMVDLANEVIARKLTVRDVERRVRPVPAPLPESAPPAGGAGSPRGEGRGARGGVQEAEVRRIRDALRRRLQTDVSITVAAGNRGEIHISFYSADDLERLLELVLGGALDPDA